MVVIVFQISSFIYVILGPDWSMAKVKVYLLLNHSLFNNLSSYIENKTFQDLSLEESKFKLNLNNDLDKCKSKYLFNLILSY